MTRRNIMARFNLVVIFGLLGACFLGSSNILYAQLHTNKGHLSGLKVSNIDPCTGTTFPPTTIGQTCLGGTLYAGTGYKTLDPTSRYMVIPSGCTDSSTTTCVGGTDSVLKTWATGTWATNPMHVTNWNDGRANTMTLANLPQTGGNTTPAANFCANMNYGGYRDWFLPSTNELNVVLYVNRAALGGFNELSGYWSSTGSRAYGAWGQSFGGGAQGTNRTTLGGYVRCVRTY